MKVISLPVKLPNWARYYAIDSLGVLVAFQNRPGNIDGRWYARGRSKDILQYDSQSFVGWKKSLVKL